MKFFKEYKEFILFMQGKHEGDLPGLEFKALKKVLKNCRCDHQSHTVDDNTASNCAHHCPVCDETFFPSLLREMSAVVACFNGRAQELVHIHLATGLAKCFLFLKGKKKKDHSSLIQESQDLVTYAMINATAMRKILKKYDKIHYSNRGLAFKSEAQRMNIEILQSPWLCELMACYINLREESAKKGMGAVLFQGCSLSFSDGKPALTCEIFDSLKVHVDLKCPICLDTVYDAFALTCGHIFCYICACSAASVPIVDGLKAASPDKNCPMCREGAVYEGAVHLTELNKLLRRSCPEYWEERFQSERLDRLQLAKDYWDSQTRSFLGI